MAVDVGVKIEGMKAIEAKLQGLGSKMDKTALKAHKRIEPIVGRSARDYAPISPKKGQYAQTLKGGKSTRTDFNPGGLVRSIKVEATIGFVHLFVPNDSEAARYAKKVHEKDGITNWGPGTIAKGSQAREQFMTRAIKDNEGNIKTIYNSEITKAVGAMNG